MKEYLEVIHKDDYDPYKKYKKGILSEDVQDMDRLYLKGTECLYHRSKLYDDSDNVYPEPNHSVWTGQFRTHYMLNDSDGNKGSLTVFYRGLLIDKP